MRLFGLVFERPVSDAHTVGPRGLRARRERGGEERERDRERARREREREREGKYR